MKKRALFLTFLATILFVVSCVNLQNQSPAQPVLFHQIPGQKPFILRNIASLFAISDDSIYQKVSLKGAWRMPNDQVFAYQLKMDPLWYVARINSSGSFESLDTVSQLVMVQYFADSTHRLTPAFASRKLLDSPWAIYTSEFVSLTGRHNRLYMTPSQVYMMDDCGIIGIIATDDTEQIIDPLFRYEDSYIYTDIDTTRPYQTLFYSPMQWVGEQWVWPKPFAGSSPILQLVHKAIKQNLVVVCNYECECVVEGEMIHPGYVVELISPPGPVTGRRRVLGYEYLRYGDGVEQALARIIADEADIN